VLPLWPADAATKPRRSPLALREVTAFS